MFWNKPVDDIRWNTRKFCNNEHISQEDSPWGLKLNSGGSGRPLGRRVFGSLNSSKKG
uniref:Uncharacterized protein n=1 Tax=Medicago truncatula TaxID=3880 RepID=A4PSE3_MEDTR|nr:hypothetical protein MtrDRAFT_AC140550g35v2 [Medicago truncatula]